jgi:hypothetical protein
MCIAVILSWIMVLNSSKSYPLIGTSRETSDNIGCNVESYICNLYLFKFMLSFLVTIDI